MDVKLHQSKRSSMEDLRDEN